MKVKEMEDIVGCGLDKVKIIFYFLLFYIFTALGLYIIGYLIIACCLTEEPF